MELTLSPVSDEVVAAKAILQLLEQRAEREKASKAADLVVHELSVACTDRPSTTSADLR